MNRRKALVAALTLGLVLTPLAANAYEADGIDIIVSNPAPAIGAPAAVTVTGAGSGEQVTATVTTNPATIPNSAITIAGTKSLTKAASTTGTAVFNITLAEAGTFTVQFTSATGAVIGDAVLSVPAAIPTTGGGTTGGTTRGGSTLPVTGSEAASLAIGAGVLMLAGAGAVVVTRRRKASNAA